MKENIIGNKYNRLVVRKYLYTNKYKNQVWECVCDCGNIASVITARLKSGVTKSCGCLKDEVRIARCQKYNETVGTHNTEYWIWSNMKDRCINSNSKDYINYGGRGIKVCDRWLNSYEDFLSDIGRRPSKLYSIDRIDNNGNYCPGNCKWSTKAEQNSNRRDNVRYEYDGKLLTVSELSKISGIPSGIIRGRLEICKNWSIKDAMFAPIKHKRKSI